jgi:hypothetical protein
VSSAREYREFADECFGWAKTANTERERGIFLQMATRLGGSRAVGGDGQARLEIERIFDRDSTRKFLSRSVILVGQKWLANRNGVRRDALNCRPSPRMSPRLNHIDRHTPTSSNGNRGRDTILAVASPTFSPPVPAGPFACGAKGTIEAAQ